MAIPKKKANPDHFIDGAKATQADQGKPQNKQPQKEVSFLLKMPFELRLKLKLKAAEKSKSMNDFVCDTLKKSLG